MIFTSIAMMLSCLTFNAEQNNLVINTPINYHEQYAEVYFSKQHQTYSTHQFDIRLTYSNSETNEYYNNAFLFRGGYDFDDENNGLIAVEFSDSLFANIFVTLEVAVNDEYNDYYYYSPCVYSSPYNQ